MRYEIGDEVYLLRSYGCESEPRRPAAVVLTFPNVSLLNYTVQLTDSLMMVNVAEHWLAPRSIEIQEQP